MLSYYFRPMTKEYASQICSWKYDEPYSIYNLDGSDETINELMSDEYYCTLNSKNTLIGFICSGNSARVPGGYPAGIYNNDKLVDIGLGLDPDLTGKGKGVDFLSHALRFLNTHHNAQQFQLVVATFNERAINVYERVGFKKEVHFTSMINGQETEFVSMTYVCEER